ncbi:MAG TPA: nuclear transport factor 2 family protein [Miltoncostaeaceae bacterium]|nr:nuclear transport factor 2 family protein [Miltoncostaeaceae bacterium]
MTTHPIAAAPKVLATPGARLVEALASRDFAALGELMDPTVWMRALLPRQLVERRGAGEVLAAFAAWYGGATDLTPVALDHDVVGGKERATYRFVLTPDWAPGTEHLIEQMAFLSVRDGLIRKIDLVCTGFMPLAATAARSSAT